MQKVRKAVIPAAGYGTRFLPATKAQPKEMLPIVDKPIIQYVVEDAVSAGIEDVVIVTGWTKRSIEDHFDYPFELEKRLQDAGKLDELEKIRQISNLANFYYVRQKGVPGNATPIYNARNIIGDEPFLVLWGDEFIDAQPSRCQQLVAAYERLGGSAVLATILKDDPASYGRYAYATGTDTGDGAVKVDRIIEKPGAGAISSNRAIVSGGIYGPEMFAAIEEAGRRLAAEVAAGGTARELVYVDAVNVLLEQGRDVYSVEIKGGTYHDCGNKLEYLKTVVEFGLKHEDLHEEFAEFLRNLKV
jgi:UTP--glucose-1-phosphate uridylyltransferase